MLPLGDNQYEDGTLVAASSASYDPTWGRVKSHHASGARQPRVPDRRAPRGYFDYLRRGVRRPAGDRDKGYYSYDLGAWHVVVLNSNCAAASAAARPARRRSSGCGRTSPRTRRACTLAYWHHPRFSSGATHGNDTASQPLWQALYDADADVVLAATTTTTSASRRRTRPGSRPGARHPRVRGRHGRREPLRRRHDPAQQRGAQRTARRRAEADAAPDELRLAVRPRGGRDVHRLRPAAATAAPRRRAAPTRRSRASPVVSRPPRAWPGRAATGTPRPTTWASPGTRIYRGGTQISGLSAPTTSYTDTSVAARHGLQLHRARGGRGREPLGPNTPPGVTTPNSAVLTIAARSRRARRETSTPTTNYAADKLRRRGPGGTAAESYLRFAGQQASPGTVRRARSCACSPTRGPWTGPRWLHLQYDLGRDHESTGTTARQRTSAATDDKGAVASNTWVEYRRSPNS